MTVINKLNISFELVCVNMIDATSCLDSFKYISATLVSLQMMMNIALPHINVMNKIDLVDDEESDLLNTFQQENERDTTDPVNSTSTQNDYKNNYGNIQNKMTIPFNLSFYTEVANLDHLLFHMKNGNHHHTFKDRYFNLSQAICSLIEDNGLVSYIPVCVNVS